MAVSIRTSALGLVCLLASAPLWAAQTLTLCFENKPAAPWRTGNEQGLNFDMLHQVQARIGVRFIYRPLPWKRCLAQLSANQVDGAFSASFTDERQAFGAYPKGAPENASQHMHYARYVLVRKKGSPVSWDGTVFSHVDGVIGFQLGYSIGSLMRSLNVGIDESGDSVHNFGRKVLTGRIAAAALYDSAAAQLMRGPLASQLEVAPVPLAENPYFMMLSHSLVRSQPELAQRIWRSIEQVCQSPAYRSQAQAVGVTN